ncbi:E3 ubiquitin-protein ligase RAD18-like [Megalops cyprinoides]|uniref:E3 ubiquitin-protein ligase RAD18-like n=1 Tax=Megalops cyprinoides TaxID=118141 RepID=UPI001863E187|nr:E3 ubiquitin-protein ligase RAD18-like [Megalops cyprinoides]
MSLSSEQNLPPNLVCLKNVDNLLRCPICFDYLNISMMAQQCSHTFCSLCIRKFLSYKSQCPVCNVAITELDLRNNRILDDIVRSFKASRQQLSQMSFDSPPTPSNTPSSSATYQRGPKREGTLLSHFLQRGSSSSLTQEPKPPPACAVKEPAAPEPPHVMVGAVDESHTPAAAQSSSSPPSTSGEVNSVVKVECPVCSVAVSQPYINKHLDSCLAGPEKKENVRRYAQLKGFRLSLFYSSLGKRKPLAKVVYTLLSMQELKRRLKEFHLSTQGSREQLVRRHQDFVHMYNAQCDSLVPKSAEDIAKEVEKMEKTRSQMESKSKCPVFSSKSQTEEETEAVNSNYRKEHSDEFSRLVAQVKSRWKVSRRAQIDLEVKEKGDDHKECASGTSSKDVISGTKMLASEISPDVASEETVLKPEIIQRSPGAPTDNSVSRNMDNTPRGKRKAFCSSEDLTQDARSCKQARQR